ncbi:phytoene desaturase [Patescibacteria group bacterium]|nr:MAG: phytoene desaturase [Patescibacteria group bacterium]
MAKGRSKKVVIIGAGLGGLSAAIRLLAAGYQVELYEKESLAGGRAQLIEQDGYRFDIGPTLLMMTDVLEQTFAVAGKNMGDYLELQQLDPNYRIAFADGSGMVLTSNLAELTKELAAIDPAAPQQFHRFFAKLAMMYRLGRDRYIDKNFDSLFDFIDPVSGLNLLRHGGLRSLYGLVGSYFTDPRLRQAFSFQSMYLGVSPYDAPAIYAIIAYMETAGGIWYAKGGMHQVPRALAKLVGEMGGVIKLNAPVKRIVVESGRATGIELESGKRVKADIVISNADLSYTYNQLLTPLERPKMSDRRLSKLKQSYSAMLFYWGVNADVSNLEHHNVVFSQDYKANFDQVFNQNVLPENPAFYTHVPTKTDPTVAPEGRHVVYTLVPVPNLTGKVDWAQAEKRLRQHVLTTLKQRFGVDLSRSIETEVVFGPHDFKTKYNLPDGAAFGLTHTLGQSGYFRPHNYVKGVSGLYLTGASTYPGSGVPMVLLSGKLVAERIMRDIKK